MAAHQLSVFDGFFLFFIICSISVFGSGAGKCNNCGSTGHQIFQIKYRALSKGYFWFGRSWQRRCFNAKTDPIDCYNPDRRPESLATRLFGKRGPKMMNNLNKRLIVRYKSPPGRYIGCNDVVEQKSSKVFYAYPTGRVEATPWQTRFRPQISWTGKSGRTLHTLIIVDAGLGNIHGLWVDIPGNTLNQGKELVPYKRPLNFRPIANPYLFILFKQKGKSSADIRNLRSLPKSILKKFVDKSKLVGPVAMNWIMISFDKYSAQEALDTGFVNNCPHFVKEATGERQQEPFRSFLPAHVSQTTFLNVSFTTSAIQFDVCCRTHSYKEETVYLNPIGSGIVNSVNARTGYPPTINIIPRAFYPFKEQKISTKRHTVLFLAADVKDKSAGTYRKPLLHWVLTDIKNGDGNTGRELIQYIGPLPPDAKHFYHFVVYEHTEATTSLTAKDLAKYAYDNCHPLFKGRCLFDVENFVSDKGLKFVGASWMTVQPDWYVRYKFGKVLGFGEDAVCQNVPGYSNPCSDEQ
ncbi:uncharacterized protein C56G2.4-like [Tubulanus polymorphus]|uniref:uncharacterized protein C56G2.4-like n=1 Tax=Tubulanus polymorphus TaxID=672921 RepID=UPI003DA4669B